MWLQGEIRSAVEKLGIDAVDLRTDDVCAIEENLACTFARPGTEPLWERLRASSGVHDPDGWRRVGDFSSGEAILLIRDGEHIFGLQFASALDIPRVLAECSGFEFYVCNRAWSYLLAYNHHDVLIGAGTAAPWVASIPLFQR